MGDLEARSYTTRFPNFLLFKATANQSCCKYDSKMPVSLQDDSQKSILLSTLFWIYHQERYMSKGIVESSSMVKGGFCPSYVLGSTCMEACTLGYEIKPRSH